MPEDDLGLLLDAAQKAGEIALRHTNAGTLNTVEKPGGQGPVTAADLEIDEMLKSQLLAARPDYGWLSEESDHHTDRLQTEHAFIIDPIDGTRAYVEGGRGFCHALALADTKGIIAAVAHFPALERTYAALRGKGATRNGEPLSVREPNDIFPQVLISKTMTEKQHWPGGVPQMQRAHRPSMIGRMCFVAEGRFAATVTFRPSWEWDVAAGALIVTEAGGQITDAEGRSLNYNQPDPRLNGLIAAAPDYHATLLTHRHISCA